VYTDVVNGERNQIHLVIENLSDQNVTLHSVGGSFHYPESGALVKNVHVFPSLALHFHANPTPIQTTSLSYSVPLLEKSKLQIPYTFYSE
jgi:hypothetical protein